MLDIHMVEINIKVHILCTCNFVDSCWTWIYVGYTIYTICIICTTYIVEVTYEYIHHGEDTNNVTSIA